MKKIFLNITTLLLCPLLWVSCTAKKEDSQLAIFKKIDEEVLKNSKAYATLQEATSSIGHRLTGSENGQKAEEYVYNKFKEYGFDNVSYVPFEVESWSRGDISVELDGTPVPAVSLAHSPVSADVTAQVVDMGNGLESDYMNNPDAVKGKIALVYIGLLQGSPTGLINLHRSEKTALAIEHGAQGIIIFNQVKDSVLLTGTASVTGAVISIPAVCIGKEVGMNLKKQLATKQNLQAHITMNNYSGPIKARNVTAMVKGTEMPDERIIICGHLDSWDLATGAIDNGIGSFSVLDIARTFKANSLTPKRTVQFMLFMGEEEGLLGSRYMVRKEIEGGTFNQIKYVINLDMAGNPVGIDAGGKLDNEAFFTNLGAKIQQIDSAFHNEFNNKVTLHSDFEPFVLEGIPYLEFISDLDQSVYDCYHSNCDTFDLVHEDDIRNNVRFGTMILYALANADPLPAKRMDSETTKQVMIDNNLEKPLTIAGDWKWGEKKEASESESKQKP